LFTERPTPTPEPTGLADEPLSLATVRWTTSSGGHLAVLRYEDVRTLPDLRTTVLDFYDSAYRASDSRTGWNLVRHDSVNGITDPTHTYAWNDVSARSCGPCRARKLCKDHKRRAVSRGVGQQPSDDGPVSDGTV